MNLKPTRNAGVLAGVAAVALALGMSGTALAVSLDRAAESEQRVQAALTFTGKGVTNMSTVAGVDASSFGSTSWQSLAGSSNYLTVPSGKTRIASTTFSAVGACQSASPAGCFLRVVARRSGSATLVELHPKANSPYFDSAGASNDFWESHTVIRTGTLGAGRWQIFVQAMVDSGASLTLLSWTHKVELYAR